MDKKADAMIVKEIRARRFVLEDSEGRERATLGMLFDPEYDLPGVRSTPILSFKGRTSSEPRVTITDREVTVGWTPHPDNGDRRNSVSICLDADGNPQIVISRTDKTPALLTAHGIGETHDGTVITSEEVLVTPQDSPETLRFPALGEE